MQSRCAYPRLGHPNSHIRGPAGTLASDPAECLREIGGRPMYPKLSPLRELKNFLDHMLAGKIK